MNKTVISNDNNSSQLVLNQYVQEGGVLIGFCPFTYRFFPVKFTHPACVVFMVVVIRLAKQFYLEHQTLNEQCMGQKKQDIIMLLLIKLSFTFTHFLHNFFYYCNHRKTFISPWSRNACHKRLTSIELHL
jgi:hypothetical protein